MVRNPGLAEAGGRWSGHPGTRTHVGEKRASYKVPKLVQPWLAWEKAQVSWPTESGDPKGRGGARGGWPIAPNLEQKYPVLAGILLCPLREETWLKNKNNGLQFRDQILIPTFAGCETSGKWLRLSFSPVKWDDSINLGNRSEDYVRWCNLGAWSALGKRQSLRGSGRVWWDVIAVITVHSWNLRSSWLAGRCIGPRPSGPALEAQTLLSPQRAIYAPLDIFLYLFPLDLSFQDTVHIKTAYFCGPVTSRAVSSQLLVWALPTVSSCKGQLGLLYFCIFRLGPSKPLPPPPAINVDWTSGQLVYPLTQALHFRSGVNLGLMSFHGVGGGGTADGGLQWDGELDLAICFRTRPLLQAIPGGCSLHASKPSTG